MPWITTPQAPTHTSPVHTLYRNYTNLDHKGRRVCRSGSHVFIEQHKTYNTEQDGSSSIVYHACIESEPNEPLSKSVSPPHTHFTTTTQAYNTEQRGCIIILHQVCIEEHHKPLHILIPHTHKHTLLEQHEPALQNKGRAISFLYQVYIEP